MTFDLMQHGGRTREQVEANEEIAALSIIGLIATIVVGLVATVAGWL